MKKIFLLTFFFISFLISNSLLAEYPRYIDFKYVLNESVAGKKAQDGLKKKLQDGYSTNIAMKRELLKKSKSKEDALLNIGLLPT